MSVFVMSSHLPVRIIVTDKIDVKQLIIVIAAFWDFHFTREN